MTEFIKDALRYMGLLRGRSVASFNNRRGYHLSVFTDLVDKLKQENQAIEKERALQIKKAEELRKKIQEIEKIDTELATLVNANNATADKIGRIL